jgi:hypothetical protein
MKGSRILIAALTVACAAVVTLSLLHGATASADENQGAAVAGNVSIEDAQAFEEYALYALGSSFEGLEQTAIARSVETEEDDTGAFVVDFITFVYGDCDVEEDEDSVAEDEDSACLPPLQVQSFPLCHSDPANYPEEIQAEGTSVSLGDDEGIVYMDGTRLEIVVGDVLVRLFDEDPDRLLRAGEAISQFNPTAVDGGDAPICEAPPPQPPPPPPGPPPPSPPPPPGPPPAPPPPDSPTLVFPENNGTMGPSDSYAVELTAEGSVRVQFATDPDFESIVCDTHWFHSGHFTTWSWQPAAEIWFSGASCSPDSDGEYYWRVKHALAPEYPDDVEWTPVHAFTFVDD